MLVTLIFQLCALQTYASTDAPLGSSLALLWCIGNCILYVGVLTFCIIERRWLFADARTGTGINFIPFIKTSITIVTHLVVLLEALIARGVYRALDVRVASVDGALGHLTDRAASRLARARTHFRNKLLLFCAFCCAIELGILALVYSDPVQLALWCLTVPSLVIIRLKHLHHAYHIDRLTARFDILREQLESLVTDGVSPGRPKPTEATAVPPNAQTSLIRWKMNGPSRPAVIVDSWTGLSTMKSPVSIGATSQVDRVPLRRMFVAKGTYLTLWHASKDLNGCCVYSQLANLLQNFIQCTCDLYSLYALLYLNQLDDIFAYILSIVATFTALGVVLAACENCKNQVGQMGQLLYKRLHGDEADLLAKMLENFSLLLQHTPMSFSLGGFFDMDFVLLKEIAAAITTYMVIFIQFMPKEDTPTDATTASNSTLANSTTTVTPE
uniref:Gustatory receptor n=1 Tax=Anopheles coluzzii TaxID=1518534 RepID=A0A6E8VYY8_ANOCL